LCTLNSLTPRRRHRGRAVLEGAVRCRLDLVVVLALRDDTVEHAVDEQVVVEHDVL